MVEEKVILIVDEREYECIVTYESDFLAGECREPFVHTQADDRKMLLMNLTIGIQQALREKVGK